MTYTANAELKPSKITQVAMLGTGTPHAEPHRSGPSVAIIVNDTPYIVDFGPGVVRRASALTPKYGGKIKGLESKNLKTAFLTHLHSDHSVGLPDLILSPWVMGRTEPLNLFGPEGIETMAEYILKAYDHDIKYRLYGLQPANNTGWRVNTTVVKEGVVYQDDNVKVEAFPVKHGSWPDAFGYRFTTPDRVIVISGDSAPTPKLVEYARGADILIHEVIGKDAVDNLDEFWQQYHANNHTNSFELAKIANETKPKLLVLYHILLYNSTEAHLMEEMNQSYKGDFVLSSDLDVY